jgi:hypothetical protein
MRVRLAFALLVLLPGCGASEDQLRTRVAFDMNCNQDNIQIIEIDDKTRGVRACGQQATYVEICDGPKGGWTTGCTWALNTDSRRTRRAEAD